MTASAAVVSARLVDVFDHVPEYAGYDHADVVKEFESEYRVALGRLAKSWGDSLLDLAEHPRSPLTKREARTIDALLERISEVFDHLNTFERVMLPESEWKRREALRLADSSILHTLEETAELMRALHPSRGASLWLSHHAASMYRRLRRLSKMLERRNRVLIGAGS